MRVDRLNRDQIRFVYQEYMQKDFPDNERKPLKIIEKAVMKQTYECFGLFEGEEICGYAFFVRQVKTSSPTSPSGSTSPVFGLMTSAIK